MPFLALTKKRFPALLRYAPLTVITVIGAHLDIAVKPVAVGRKVELESATILLRWGMVEIVLV